MRVVVAMSGGVDSAVAAALLREQGHDVVGVTLHLWDAPGEQRVGRCCAPEDRDDARRVCDHLGIPHYVVDESSAFRRDVVDDLVRAYASGRTPAPCVRCNQLVKLASLFDVADAMGAASVATGHYARIVRDAAGSPALWSGRDATKDQSYFLFGVEPERLARLSFPLGEMTKTQVRAEAARARLPNAGKGESQELCFVPDGDVAGFVAREGAGPARGLIRDATGRVLGSHEGIHHFTVGQRRGLGLGGGATRYVLRIVPGTADVIVGAADELWGSQLVARDARWCSGPAPGAPFEARVRIRYRHSGGDATVIPSPDGLSFRVSFHAPQRAITPGQAAVVYDAERVVGGGQIDRWDESAPVVRNHEVGSPSM